jgi:hypothetical protein
MTKTILCAGAFAAALLLSGCVTPSTETPLVTAADAAAEAQKQAILAIRMRVDEQTRVAAVADRLFVANADLCPESTRGIGAGAETLENVSPSFRAAAASSLGFSDAPKIEWIAAGGPADQAGLKSGDLVVAVDEHAIPPKGGAKTIRQILQDSKAADMSVQFRRGDAVRTVVVHPVKMCRYEVAILDTDALNASTDGRRIVINRGMLRFVKTDDELALVMAHELAHDTERHIRAKTANATMGLAGGAAVDLLFALGGVNTGGAFMKAGQAAGAGYASAAFESEADYVGMYYMARAGYDVDGVEDFWRRMAVEQPSAIFVKSDHPATPARYLAIAKARDEIQAKRKAGAVLLPERKAGRKPAETLTGSTATPASAPAASHAAS